MTVFRSLSCAAAIAAAVSMASAPAGATSLHLRSAPAGAAAPAAMFDATSANTNHHRRYYRYHHHNHVDAGDVLAGVLILGTIAAVAGAASKKSREREYPTNPYPDQPYDYRERGESNRYDNSRGIDRAVSMCVREIERDVRVDRVDNVVRDGEGWAVRGTIYNGDSFTCVIGPDGKIRNVDVGGREFAAAAPVIDRQLDDQRYAQARARIDQQRGAPTAAPSTTEPQPAYPGGPLPGEGGNDSDDGRYDTAEAPDFT